MKHKSLNVRVQDFATNELRNSLTILILLINICVCKSQSTITISGRITDKSTSLSIENANISLLKNDSTFIQGSVSDSIGHFSFDIIKNKQDEKYIFKINHINYEKKYENIRISDNSIHLIQLISRSNSLSEVQVIGTQRKVKRKLNMEYKVTDKLRDESLRATQLLENIPTVFVDYNQNVYIKGSSNILIMKNGLELPNNSLIDQIPPSTIRKIEIINSIPSKYANKNYTAIMNIITKREKNLSLLLDNNSSFDGQMYDAKVNFSVDTEKHSMYAFYKLYYRNFTEKYSIRDNNDFSQKDTTLYFRTKPRKECDNEFFYGYSYHPTNKLTIGVDGYLSLYRENFNSVFDDAIRSKYADFKESFNTQNYKCYVNYQDSLNKLQGTINYNHINVNDDYYYFYGDERTENQEEKREISNFQLDYKRKIKQHISLNIGAEYAYSKNRMLIYDPVNQTNNKDQFDGNNLSGYAESAIEINDKWNLEVGLNLNNYTRSFKNSIKTKAFYIYPKLNFSYSMNEKNNLNLGCSSYINNPTLWQMLSFTKEDSPEVFYRGNPYLKPEKHSTMSLEYSYSNGDFYYANSIYLKDARNKIQRVISSENAFSLISYANLNKRNDYGVDLTLSWGVTKWWKLNVYGDFRYRNIPDNHYYKNNMTTVSGNLQSSWSLSSKLSVMAKYMYNGKELVYNGYSKSFNSSLVVVAYSLLDNLSLYFLAIEPLGRFESYSSIFNKEGFIETRNNIKTRTFLLSLKYNIFKNKKQAKKRVYNNEDRKY